MANGKDLLNAFLINILHFGYWCNGVSCFDEATALQFPSALRCSENVNTLFLDFCSFTATAGYF